ncbi:MAG: hypothetical protein K2Q12_04570 [Rickettsiales bacterium]|nr:hypothetical protein [Rickettsiales bacterium]
MATEAIEAAAGETIGEMVMGGMEDITRPPVQLYAATSGSPLVPDNGLSARVIAVTGTTQESAIAPDLTTQNSEQVADTLHSMDRYRDAALDFKEPGKQEQLRMKLEKVAIDMKA